MCELANFNISVFKFENIYRKIVVYISLYEYVVFLLFNVICMIWMFVGFIDLYGNIKQADQQTKTQDSPSRLEVLANFIVCMHSQS